MHCTASTTFWQPLRCRLRRGRPPPLRSRAPTGLRAAHHCPGPAEIPPEREAIVFEEIATMEFPFEGIPTVPPRKDMDHLAFFCGGCRWAAMHAGSQRHGAGG